MNLLSVNKELMQARKEFTEYEKYLLGQISQEIKDMQKKKEYPSRYYKVLRLRFYKRMTYDEISKIMGVTRERIRQIEARILET